MNRNFITSFIRLLSLTMIVSIIVPLAACGGAGKDNSQASVSSNSSVGSADNSSVTNNSDNDSVGGSDISAQSNDNTDSTGTDVSEQTELYVKRDSLTDVAFTTRTGGRYVSSDGASAPQFEVNDVYDCAVIDVAAGERYVLGFAIQSAKSVGVILTNSKGKVVEQLCAGKNAFYECKDLQILVPEGAVKAYINTRVPTPITVKKLTQTTVKKSDITTVGEAKQKYDFTLIQNSRFVSDATTLAVLSEANENYKCTEIKVSEGDSFMLDFAIQSAKSVGVILADKDKKAVSQSYLGENSYLECYDVKVEIPSGVAYMYVNTRNPFEMSVYKLIKSVIPVVDMATTMKVGALNCGAFSYGESGVTAETYAANLKNAIAAVNADMFSFEDVVDAFSAGVSSVSVLNADNKNVISLSGVSAQLRLKSTIIPESVTVLALACSISGSTKTTARSYAMKTTYYLGDKYVAVYNLHLVAEAHISSDKQSDGTSLSQKLRQLQFARLIADAKVYDASIFVGDFNSQQASEYGVFTQNGYSLANCGSFGTFATLRDIPADNVIVSKEFEIIGMGVIDSYALNTDHKPIYATVSLKNT